MFRHTAFFLFNEHITPDKQLAMLKGLAYMRFEIPSVLALDYGSDLFGGSTRLREIKPYRRTPRWRAAEEGPPSNYDVALQLDFADAAGNQAYNEDDVHHEVGEYNAAIGQPELTARIDWEYEGEPLIRRGHVRHSAMFLWADHADTAAREGALEQVRRLESADEVEALTLGHNIGKLTTDFDWIFDIHTPDEASAKRLIHSDVYADVMRAVAPVTKYEWTARISHIMRGL